MGYREICLELSSFYLGMWRKLEMPTDETRWLRSMSQDEAAKLIDARTSDTAQNKLVELVDSDILRAQIASDFRRFKEALKVLEKHTNPTVPRLVDEVKEYFREQGLRYAALMQKTDISR